MESIDLFREILHLMGNSLGDIIKEQAGQQVFDIIEKIRSQSKELRENYNAANFKDLYNNFDNYIFSLLDLNPKIREEVSRGFALYLILNNIAELAYQAIMLSKSIDGEKILLRNAIKNSLSVYTNREEFITFLKTLSVTITLTQHPTEVKRRTILLKEKKIYSLLLEYFTKNPNHNIKSVIKEEIVDTPYLYSISEEIKEHIEAFWLSAEVRLKKPTLEDEIEAASAFANYSLFDSIDKLYLDIWEEFELHFEQKIPFFPILNIGSWVGGDRDGNPYVTVETTRYALNNNRKLVLLHYINKISNLTEHISISERRIKISPDIIQYINETFNFDPDLPKKIFLYQDEPYRQFLMIIKYKLEQTIVEIDGKAKNHFKSCLEFQNDLILFQKCLQEIGANKLATGKLQQLINSTKVYGFYWAKLDIRQHSKVFESLIDEIYELTGISGYKNFTKELKVSTLTKSLSETRINFYAEDLSIDSRSIWDLFKLIRNYSTNYGKECFGSIIISMTEDESDILEVLFAQYIVGMFDPTSNRRFPQQIAPLFETINDLENSPQIMENLFKNPVYNKFLDQIGKKQEIMIGYSDSAKDGGFFASQWNIYLVQENLIRLCKKYDIKHFFFHGRGGSIGRGGVDLHQALIGLPNNSVRYGFKTTEQGEVIAQKYLHPEIAYNKLLSMVSGIFSAQKSGFIANDGDRKLFKSIVDISRSFYRDMIYNDPNFYTYFTEATPIEFISYLNIGSRPAKRKRYDSSFDDLRAIPWIFAWTQNRTLFPVWAGIGHALKTIFNSNPETVQILQKWYKNWTFFSALIESISVQLLKADMNSAKKYSTLSKHKNLFNKQFSEYFQTRSYIRKVTEESHLLSNSQFLQRAVSARSPYLDPLTLIQIHAIKRFRNKNSKEELNIILLTITGIAAGMKNTG